MSRNLMAVSFLACTALAAPSVPAQQIGKPVQATSPTVEIGQQLSKRQAELVRRVNAYFNQLTSLRGSFVQTSADNQRLRGIFHMARPGRFRFDFNPPSRVVIISDGRYVAVQDHDLNTDDRWDLNYTPFHALLQKDVDLLRDARILEVQEGDDTIAIAFEDRGTDASGRIRLFLASKPTLQLKAWIAKDAQGFDTRIDLTEVRTIDEPDAKLFNPALRLERQR